jgi:predicted nucleotidyltransferase
MINTVDVSLLLTFCKQHTIQKMWLFGSVLRDDFTPDSDIDILVEFQPDHIPSWEFFTWEDELATLLGYPVDLMTPDSLRPWLKDTIMNGARLIYDAQG